MNGWINLTATDGRTELTSKLAVRSIDISAVRSNLNCSVITLSSGVDFLVNETLDQIQHLMEQVE